MLGILHLAKCMYFDKNSPNFQKNPHEYVTNWLECPEYLGKATINVAIWLKYWTFCPEFPEFLENSIEFADILPTISQLLV